MTNQIYVASKEGLLYEARNGAQTLLEVGKTGFKGIHALAFHPKGSLWGWAQGAGLFQIIQDENSKLDLPGTLIIPYDGDTEIMDLTWDIQGIFLYGVGNSEQKNTLLAYNPKTTEVSLICEELMGSLEHEINTLEIVSKNTLLFTFGQDSEIIFNILDLETCEITTTGEITTPYYQLKGIGWPDCTHSFATF